MPAPGNAMLYCTNAFLCSKAYVNLAGNKDLTCLIKHSRNMSLEYTMHGNKPLGWDASEQALAAGPGPAAGHTCAADPTLARGPAFAAVQA